MRAQLQIEGYEIEFDREATAACYARIPVPDPEACGCGDCRNWIAARENVLPAEFRHLLSQLGIPINGEIEIGECPGQTRPHFYMGSYYIVGRIISGDVKHKFDMGDFHLSFAPERSHDLSAFEGQQVCQLNFDTEIGEYLSEV
jgi:hypothetical protein